MVKKQWQEKLTEPGGSWQQFVMGESMKIRQGLKKIVVFRVRAVHKDKKVLRGSITVEMSYFLPTIIILFLLIIYTVFFYHDKNVLIGGAAETAVLGAQVERHRGEETDLHSFFRERIRGKLILLNLKGVEIERDGKWVRVTAYAAKRWMGTSTEQKAAIPEPEKEIRKKRQLDSFVN